MMQTGLIHHPGNPTIEQKLIPEGAYYCPLPAGQWHRGSAKGEERLTKKTVVFLPQGIQVYLEQRKQRF